jgi:protein phosphatase
LPGGPVPFIIVADGVTSARVGSGDLASQTACRFLRQQLSERLLQADTLEQLEDELTAACLEASRLILRLSLEQTPLPEGVDLTDLMSTTVVIGVVRGGTLTLASVGDSRAYLVTGSGMEQLTVDDDVRCIHLAAGVPPEEILKLGEEAEALYACLGVAEVGSDGQFHCALERSIPRVIHWPLIPGDIVLLCSDGLIEEGLFLSPAEVFALVSEHRDLPAQALAERLVAEADGRQRLPTPDRPDGVGDNITCAVFKVLVEAVR